VKALIKKYNVAGPRYTSYPTVPHWNPETFSKKGWIESIKNTFIEKGNEGISVYIHLPYCESLCTFCGCHKHITKQHDTEQPYVETVLKEWQLYLALLPSKPVLKELHLGGGTPTFFSSSHLQLLMDGILDTVTKHADLELSIEGHPNNTTKNHLEILYSLGFRRISFGIQDYDTVVQKAINRHQTYSQVEKVNELAREIGFTSISHDLIYGLPFQKEESISNSIRLTKDLMPDRISLYGYAHVPWVKGVGQRGFDDNDIPSGTEKQQLYELAKEELLNAGYKEVGMDHFALPTDALYIAQLNNTLHRNFMGYTTNATRLMIGLGMSAISDSSTCFAQNKKSVKDYMHDINQGELAVYRGHQLSENEMMIKRHILDLMCQFETTLPSNFSQTEYGEVVLKKLEELVADEIVFLTPNKCIITPLGKPFVRNVCMAFDPYIQLENTSSKTFSSTI
jgi:oxygen-independent coproporphyrinogen-3 oxidase